MDELWFVGICAHMNVLLCFTESNNLVGPLPEEISTLSTAEVIIFFNNFLSSSIPDGIGNLTELGLLDLESNDLTGIFFSESILSLTKIYALRASFNQLNGSIPEDINRLSGLNQLWVADNQLNGQLPRQFGDLTSLGKGNWRVWYRMSGWLHC